MSVLCIVQARMKSTRLPGKVMLPLGNGTVVEFLLNRLERSKEIDTILIATSTEKEDIPLTESIDELRFSIFLGGENDVLGRFHAAVQTDKEADTIVRITADCPLMDPAIVDELVAEYAKGGADYVSNTGQRSYPDGMDVEVFSRTALEEAHSTARSVHEREHVTPWMREHGSLICRDVLYKENRSQLRITLDEREDYQVIKAIVEHFSPRIDFTLAEILDFLDNEGAHLLDINGKFASS